MKILTIDVGTGTQDIFLYDSRLDIENGYKLVLPSPTMMVRQQILAATKAERDIVLTGVTMGGGPCGWAVNGHIASGFRTFATPDAARTVNDDLNMIKEMGVILVSERKQVRYIITSFESSCTTLTSNKSKKHLHCSAFVCLTWMRWQWRSLTTAMRQRMYQIGSSVLNILIKGYGQRID